MARDPYVWRDIDAEYERGRERYEWACEDRDTDLRDMRQRYEVEMFQLRRQVEFYQQAVMRYAELSINNPVMVVQASSILGWPAHLPFVLPIKGSGQ